MRAMDGKSRTLLFPAWAHRRPGAAVWIASIFVALAIGAFLIIRRVTGSLTAPLPVPQLIGTAAGLCMWAVVVRELAAKRPFYFWAPLGALCLVAIGCSYPANRAVDWLVWLLAIGLTARLPLAIRIKSRFPAMRNLAAGKNDAISEQVIQQITRVRTAEGKHALRGTLVADFTPGERQTTLYVGFCPPFELLPRIELNVADDSEADVILSQVLHNGAQLDVRLSEPAEETIAVTIELFALESN